MKEQLELIIKARDKASTALKKIAKGLGVMAAAAGTAAVALGGLAIKEAAQFEKVISNISTLLTGDATEAVKELEEGILSLTEVVPINPDELGAATYDIVSAGIKGTSQQLKTLEAASKLAVGGLGTATEATDILTSSINAFGLDAANSEEIANVLFKTVKNGKTTVSAMSQGFGSAASSAAAANVNLEELLAATSALTLTGVPAAEAYTQLRGIFSAMQKPSEELGKLINELGFETGAALIEAEGFDGALQLLNNAVDGNTNALAELFPNVRAFTGVIALTGEASQAFTDTLADMEGGVNDVDAAFEKQKDTVSSTFQILRNKLEVILIRLGNKLLPKIKKGLEIVGQFYDDNKDAINALINDGLQLLEDAFLLVVDAIEKVIKAVQDINTFYQEHKDIIDILLILIGSFIAAWTLVTSVITIFNIVMGIATAVTTAFGVVLAFITSPIGLIILAIAAVIAIVVLLVKHWETVKETAMRIFTAIKDFVVTNIEKIGAVLLGPLGFAIGLVIKNFEKIKATAIEVFTKVKDFVGGVIDDLSQIITNFFSAVSGVGGSILNAIKSVVNSLVDSINSALQFEFSVLGKSIKIDLPDIPRLQRGTDNFQGGLAIVGERGQELVDLPRGSRVIPNRETEEIINNNQRSITVENVNINNNMAFEQFINTLNFNLA